jgi:hypothetical protein
VRELNDAGCHYVVVGSAARALLGEDVEPNDLAPVVARSAADRTGVIHALSSVGGRVVRGARRVPLTSRVRLLWEWSWCASTDLGPVDVITRFIDDTSPLLNSPGLTPIPFS